MLGPLDYVFALLSLIAEVYLVVCLCVSRNRLRYISLNIYMLAAVGVTIAQDAAWHHFGLRSPIYAYVYYYTDALLTISLFFVIMSFYHQVFQQMGAGKYVRWGSVLLLSATAFLSYLIVRRMPAYQVKTQFVVEMSQNLYFVGVVLTYLLWGAVITLRETRTRLIQLILALGIFFSADAAGYALYNLFPGLETNFLKWIPPVMGTFLPLAWAYTFTRIPEEARLATARVATRAAVQQMAAHQHS
ncbi:MAG TPA: hypothetical protein VKB26_06630 [Candidatus Acidoferrales bacterium]|nr:hypothetical protein [Candidatus Acidoferrales bacterium]